MIEAKDDGITHINIYSKGKTSLGRWLSNFQRYPFTHPEDGKFASVEGYWYWLSTKDDKLRDMHGFQAKDYGRKVGGKDWLDEDEFKDKIKWAIKYKIETWTNLKALFIKTKLPLEHYYVYGGKVVKPKEGKWILEFLEVLRNEMK